MDFAVLSAEIGHTIAEDGEAVAGSYNSEASMLITIISYIVNRYDYISITPFCPSIFYNWC